MRVLIVLPGALGDVVRALPLAGRLRHGLAEAHIGWVIDAAWAPLLVDHPWIDTLHVLERRSGPRRLLQSCREIRSARYDLALDLGRGMETALVVRASGAPRRLGVEHLGLATDRVEFGLAPRPADRAAADALLAGLPSPIVVASVGSSCSSRRWWPEATAEVLDGLASERGASTVLTGTQADAEFGDAVAGAMRTRPRNLIARTSLRELLGLIGRARVVFGPDSGTLHMAAALAVPVVSLWGATSAAGSTPWGQEGGVLVGRAACSPCFLRDCPIGRVCMRAVTPRQVRERIEAVLAA